MHKLPNIAANYKQLILIHTTNDPAYNRAYHPSLSCQAKVSWLLCHKAHLGQLKRLDKKVAHPCVGQFHNQIAQHISILLRVFGMLKLIKHLYGLFTEFFRKVETKVWYGSITHFLDFFDLMEDILPVESYFLRQKQYFNEFQQNINNNQTHLFIIVFTLNSYFHI